MSWQAIKKLNEQRGEVLVKMRNLIKKSETETRDLNADESREFDSLAAKAEAFKVQLAELKQKHYPNASDDSDAEARAFVRGQPTGNGGFGPGNRATERSVAFGLETRMADVVPMEPRWQNMSEPLSFDKFILGYATGRWHNADAERRALGESTIGAGGAMVPTPLAAGIIDRARALARVFQAGAKTVYMPSATYKIARVKTDPAGTWRAEGSAFAVNSNTFDQVTFTAKTFGVIIPMSLELLEDAQGTDGPDATSVIMETIAKAFALEIDRVCLNGTGTGQEPLGALNNTNVASVNVGANPADWSPFSNAAQTVAINNGEASAVILPPRVYGQFCRLQDTLHQPLRKPDDVAPLKFLPTTQLAATGTTAASAVLGGFENILWGTRTDLQVEISREGTVSDASAGFAYGQILIRAYLRGDVQYAHDNQICLVTGITGS
jgi:HK97 family phage major capsid protein